MPISKEFIPLFNEFVRDYKSNGTPVFFTWSKEQNHAQISKYFEELQDIIISSQEAFNDISIIDHLNTTILLSTKVNPYLVECWIKFLTKYNTKTNTYSPLMNMYIKVNPDGTPSEHLIRDLKSALEETQKAFSHTQQAHTAEIESLKRQLQELKIDKEKLAAENLLLRDKIQYEERFESIQPQLKAAQEQLIVFKELFNTLNDVTQKKTISIQPFRDLSAEVESVKPVHVSPQAPLLPAIKIELTKENPPSPPPPPELDETKEQKHSSSEEPINASPQKSDREPKSLVKSLLPKPKDSQSNQPNQQPRFFSNETFLNALNAELARRNLKKEDHPLQEIQKKNP